MDLDTYSKEELLGILEENLDAGDNPWEEDDAAYLQGEIKKILISKFGMKREDL